MNIAYDSAQNILNRRKQRIDLADVEGVFYDDRAITVEDRDHAEERLVALGLDRWLFLSRFHATLVQELDGCSLAVADPRADGMETAASGRASERL